MNETEWNERKKIRDKLKPKAMELAKDLEEHFFPKSRLYVDYTEKTVCIEMNAQTLLDYLNKKGESNGA